jgi:hypothetical protein
MDCKLSLEECFDAFVIKAENLSKEEQIIVDVKKEWIKHFTPLLCYYIKNYGIEGHIKSEDLTNLYIFYIEGIRIKQTFKNIKIEDIEYLAKIHNPIENLINDEIGNMVEMGCWLHQVGYYLNMIQFKINIFKERHSNIFQFSNDPIDWFIRNNNSYNLYCLPNKVDLKEFWKRIAMVENINLDPVLQK